MPVWGALLCVFVEFWDGHYVSQLPYVKYYVVVKSSFKHACEECESKKTCTLFTLDPAEYMSNLDLMSCLSGPCEFLLSFIVMLYPCIFCVAMLMCLVCCVFDSVWWNNSQYVSEMFNRYFMANTIKSTHIYHIFDPELYLEQHIVKKHACFRPYKSCTNQLLNLAYWIY